MDDIDSCSGGGGGEKNTRDVVDEQRRDGSGLPGGIVLALGFASGWRLPVMRNSNMEEVVGLIS